MQHKESLTRLAAFRANTLRKKRKKDSAPVRAQRPCLTESYFPKAKRGYEMMKKPPFFNYRGMVELKDKALVLGAAGLSKGFAMKGDKPDNLLELEIKVEVAEEFIKGLVDEIDYTHASNLNIEHGFKSDMLLVLSRQTNVGIAGSFPLQYSFDHNQKKLLTAFALLWGFCGCPTWDEVGIYDDLQNTMDMAIQNRLEEERNGDQEFSTETNPTKDISDTDNWRKSTGDIYLYAMNETVSVQKIAKAEKRWKKAEKTVKKRFESILDNLDYDAIETILAQKDDMALMFRGVLYLIMNKFYLYNYRSNNDEMLPVEHGYGFVWALDELLSVEDDCLNFRTEMGLTPLTWCTFYSADGVIKLPNKDHVLMMDVCGYLFHFSQKKSIFEYEKIADLQACLSSLRICGWQRFLHRAVADRRRRRFLHGVEAP
jgi:hypothetical protein